MAYIISKAGGGQVGTVQLHTHLLSRCPPVERLEKEVKEVGTSGTPLSQSIGHSPRTSIHLAVTEAMLEVGVEVPKAPYHHRGNAGLLHDPKKGPPRKGGEALGHIELHQPERGSTATLKFDDVSKELSQVQRTGLGTETHNSGAQVGALKYRGPTLRDALCPEAVDHVQDSNGTLVLGSSATRCLGNHRHVGLQELRRPDPLRLHEIE
jgi:hypothetical protein